MELYSVLPDETEETLASDVETGEIDELMDWFSYTKPLSRDLKIVARPADHGDPLFMVHAAGNKATLPPSKS